MKALALLLALGWLVASAYYVTHGYRTRKDALRKIEAEKEGTYVPPTVRAEARLPKSLEQRLLEIAGREGTVPELPEAEAEDLSDAPPHAPTKATPQDTPQAPPPPPPAGPAPAVGSLFDDPTPGSATASVSAASDEGISVSITECLTGIELPCDLVPLVQAGEFDRDPSHLILITTGFDPAQVARSFRDALAAIGYDFRSTGVTTAAASNGSRRIAVTIHDNPSAVYEGSSKRFPSAGIGSVVIELEASSAGR